MYTSVIPSEVEESPRSLEKHPADKDLQPDPDQDKAPEDPGL